MKMIEVTDIYNNNRISINPENILKEKKTTIVVIST